MSEWLDESSFLDGEMLLEKPKPKPKKKKFVLVEVEEND